MDKRIEEIKGNWEYERCIKPEDVDYLIEKTEENGQEALSND